MCQRDIVAVNRAGGIDIIREASAVYRLAGVALHGRDIISINPTGRVHVADKYPHLGTNHVPSGGCCIDHAIQGDSEIPGVARVGEINLALMVARPKLGLGPTMTGPLTEPVPLVGSWPVTVAPATLTRLLLKLKTIA